MKSFPLLVVCVSWSDIGIRCAPAFIPSRPAIPQVQVQRNGLQAYRSAENDSPPWRCTGLKAQPAGSDEEDAGATEPRQLPQVSKVQVDVTTVERIQVLSYRTSLTLAALAYSSLALSGFLGGTGLPEGTISSLEASSGAIAGGSIGASALLAPRRNEKFAGGSSSGGIGVRLLDLCLPALASAALLSVFVSSLIDVSGDDEISNFAIFLDEAQHTFTSLTVVSVCIREIAYYGLAYKVEAAVALVLALAMLVTQSPPPLPLSAGLALSLLVLSVAKIFEPLLEDLRPGQSAFFAEKDGQV